MIIPAPGKILVELYKQTHPLLSLPESITQPILSVAEVVSDHSGFMRGQLILIPTKAGLVIKEGKIKYRLINELDIVAKVIK